MSAYGILQILVLLVLLVALTRPLGAYMARVFADERTPLDPILRPIEKGIYAFGGVNPRHEMRWTRYTINMLLFNLFGIVVRLRYLAAPASASLEPGQMRRTCAPISPSTRR